MIKGHRHVVMRKGLERKTNNFSHRELSRRSKGPTQAGPCRNPSFTQWNGITPSSIVYPLTSLSPTTQLHKLGPRARQPPCVYGLNSTVLSRDMGWTGVVVVVADFTLNTEALQQFTWAAVPEPREVCASPFLGTMILPPSHQLTDGSTNGCSRQVQTEEKKKRTGSCSHKAEGSEQSSGSNSLK